MDDRETEQDKQTWGLHRVFVGVMLVLFAAMVFASLLIISALLAPFDRSGGGV